MVPAFFACVVPVRPVPASILLFRRGHLTVPSSSRPPLFYSVSQVEIMQMRHKAGTDSTLIKGIVMDHGARHPDMPRNLKK